MSRLLSHVSCETCKSSFNVFRIKWYVKMIRLSTYVFWNQPVTIFLSIMIIVQINILASSFHFVKRPTIHHSVFLSDKNETIDQNSITAFLLNTILFVRAISTISQSVAQLVLVGIANTVFAFPLTAHTWGAHLITLVNFTNLFGIRLWEPKTLVSDRYVVEVKKSGRSIRGEVETT